MQLKRCPRCRSASASVVDETIIFSMNPSDFGGEAIYSTVQCQKCGFTGRLNSRVGNAESSWNNLVRIGDTVENISPKIIVIKKNATIS